MKLKTHIYLQDRIKCIYRTQLYETWTKFSWMKDSAFNHRSCVSWGFWHIPATCQVEEVLSVHRVVRISSPSTRSCEGIWKYRGASNLQDIRLPAARIHRVQVRYQRSLCDLQRRKLVPDRLWPACCLVVWILPPILPLFFLVPRLLFSQCNRWWKERDIIQQQTHRITLNCYGNSPKDTKKTEKH